MKFGDDDVGDCRASWWCKTGKVLIISRGVKTLIWWSQSRDKDDGEAEHEL